MYTIGKTLNLLYDNVICKKLKGAIKSETVVSVTQGSQFLISYWKIPRIHCIYMIQSVQNTWIYDLSLRLILVISLMKIFYWGYFYSN